MFLVKQGASREVSENIQIESCTHFSLLLLLLCVSWFLSVETNLIVSVETYTFDFFLQYVTLKEMPAVLVFKDDTYFVYDGKFQSFNSYKAFHDYSIVTMRYL